MQTEKQTASEKESVLRAQDLRKTFHGRKHIVEAVRGVDLTIDTGEIFGFLGPNGAGKTTTLRMLSTLLPIDSGTATVAGHDVQTQPRLVREQIGYVSQLGGADRLATGREDLILQGRLYGMSLGEAQNRADEVISALDLTEFVDRKARSYSGGQKRRLHVALGIMHNPRLLFLDEPSTGLDPQNRANLWVQIKKLRSMGTTIFLTTHYLEEADALADRLAIMDHGEIVAEGTSKELKRDISGDSVVISFKEDVSLTERAAELFSRQPYVREVRPDSDTIRLYVDDGPEALPLLMRLIDAESLPLRTISLSEPSLDDVFLHHTGRSLRDAERPGGGDGGDDHGQESAR